MSPGARQTSDPVGKGAPSGKGTHRYRAPDAPAPLPLASFFSPPLRKTRRLLDARLTLEMIGRVAKRSDQIDSSLSEGSINEMLSRLCCR